MPETKEMQASIEAQIEQVTEIRKPNMAIVTFISEFSRYLAQVEKDLAPLTSAGFNPALLPLYIALFDMLNLEHAKRVAAEGKSSSSAEAFQSGMKNAKIYKDVLKVVLKFVLAETGDSTVKAAYDKIKPGTSNADILHDIQSMIVVLREHLSMASLIKPAGQDINDNYLDTVFNETQEVLALEGEVSATSTIRSIQVERQNKLITLAMDAIDKIKQYAEAAFIMDKDHYSEYYTNQVTRQRYSTKSSEEDIIDEELYDDQADNTLTV